MVSLSKNGRRGGDGEGNRGNLHASTLVPAPPVRFARLPMAVSERLCWRPIQARAISQTACEARGRP
jgi:hypothetical protein